MLDAELLADETTAEVERARLRQAALEILNTGQSIVLYSARGLHDVAMQASNERLRLRGIR
ncbi:MAG: hypothetical protein U0X75_26850 [Acidobacteriota bacterium]